jgi:hypothetical protein
MRCYGIHFLLTLILLLGCANQPNEPDINPVAGGASDTETARVQGVVSIDANTFGIKIILYLFNMDFIPKDSMHTILALKVKDTVDNNSPFEITSLDPGHYRILAVEDASQFNAFIGPFSVDSSDTTIDLGTTLLAMPGNIAGYALPLDTGACLDVKAFIKGSPFMAYSDTTGYFIIEDVPSSRVELSYNRHDRLCHRGDTAKPFIDTTTYTYDSLIQVQPQDTALIINILD